MKYRINNYQVIYLTGCRDKIKLGCPIYTEDIEAVRTKLCNLHSGLGKKVVGVNLECEIYDIE